MAALASEILAMARKQFNSRQAARFCLNLTLKQLNRNMLLQMIFKLLPYVISLLVLGIIIFAEEEEEEEEEILDKEALFRRLSPSSHEALNQADGIRSVLGQGEVHMEHLIAGLLKKKGGPTERLLGGAAIDLTNFSKIVETDLPEEGSYTPSPLTALPPLSKHVERALVAAHVAAGSQESDPIRSRHLLYGALSITDCHVIQALVDQGIHTENIDLTAPPSSAKTASRLVIAGFGSDALDGEDLLGVTKEVEALCSVLAAKSVEPPLSLGLFGDWGSGKSFFMQMMEKRIERLKEESQKEASQHPERKIAYCTDIVQIKFNAWHYIDTNNLWASLASSIFEELASALVKKDDTDSEYRRAYLLTDTIKSKEELAKAEREKEKAETKLRESEESLSKLEQDAAAIEANLTRQAFVQATLHVTIRQPEVLETVEEAKRELNAKLEEAAKELKYPSTYATESGVKTQLQNLKGIWGGIQALAIARQNAKGNRAWQLLTAAVVIILIVSLLIVYKASLVGLLGSVIVFLVGMIVPVAPLIPGVWRAVRIIKQVQEERKRLIDEAQQRSRVARLQEVVNAQEQLEKAQRVVQNASDKVLENEQEIEKLRADRQMSDFIKQRQASAVYTKHLGVIAQAREDFEKLSILLAKEKKDAKMGTSTFQEKQLLPRIDRIILYIDDLDRCPEDRVVDVLQAIHLLLAFPLFIVVVGVDSRWLLHSLRQHSKAFQNDMSEHDGTPDEENIHWQSTPFDYLEKIFQIPFTLWPIEKSGFDRLVDTLAAPQDEATSATTSKGVLNDTKRAAPLSEGMLSNPDADRLGQTLRGGPQLQEDIDLNPDYLLIQEWERAVMKKLFRFIPSPRAAKRFINVYRLLRASVDSNKLQAFTGNAEAGQHRSALLLLALLIGYPAQATEILLDLLEREHTETWWKFIDTFKERADKGNTLPESATQARASKEGTERWQRLMESLNLATVRSLIPEDQSCTDFVAYAPQVARYSFQSGRVLMALRSVDADS
jgi:KAP family P-loop domain